VHDQLDRADPTNQTNRHYLSRELFALAQVDIERGDPASALPRARTAVDIMIAAIRRDPTSAESANMASAGRRWACEALRDLARPAEAAAECEEAVDLLGLRARDSARLGHTLAVAHLALAEALVDAGRAAPALAAAREAVADFAAILHKPGRPSPDVRVAQARAQIVLANLEHRAPPAEAAGAVEEALAASEPEDLEIHTRAAESFLLLGGAPAYRRAIALVEGAPPGRARAVLALGQARLARAIGGREGRALRRRSHEIAAALLAAGALGPRLRGELAAEGVRP
jgi:hypothetical protein